MNSFFLVFGRILHYFHAHTGPLLPPKHWIAPLWMTVYGSQVNNDFSHCYVGSIQGFQSSRHLGFSMRSVQFADAMEAVVTVIIYINILDPSLKLNC